MNNFNAFDKSYKNVRDRMTIAVDALEEIWGWGRPIPVTENEKRIQGIAFNALLKINKLLVEATQD